MRKNDITLFENSEFNGIKINIINADDGTLLLDMYQCGMIMGHVRYTKNKPYPRKDRINQCVKNAEIQPVVHNGTKYITEPQLYDLMIEMYTKEVKPFKHWVTSEVLPSIRKYGVYMTDEVLLKAAEDSDYLKYIHSLIASDKEKKLLTTYDTVRSDGQYAEWSKNTITPLLSKLQSYHTKHSNLDLLQGAYKALSHYDNIDVFNMRDKFVTEQMHIAHDNNLKNIQGADFYRVPILYHIYKDEAVRMAFVRLLCEFIETDIEKANEQKAVM